MKHFGLYVNGLYVQTPQSFPINAPLAAREAPGKTRLAIWTAQDQANSPQDDNPIEAALQGAHETFAQIQSGFFPLAERLAFLGRLRTKLSEQKENLAQLMCQETGKPIQLARAEVDRGLSTIDATIEAAPERLRPQTLSLPAGSPQVEVRREPHGPLLAMAPFNYPLNLVLHKLVPALAAGCPVILKPSPKAQLSALTLTDFCHACELPPGMLSTIQVENSLVEGLIRDNRIAHISFTGSANVGWKLAALTTKPFALELGGNAPNYVDTTADLGVAAKKLALAANAYAGQVCISVQNIFVHLSVAKEFETLLKAAYIELKWGQPDLDEVWSGPVIDADSAARLRQLESSLIKEGAVVVAEAPELARGSSASPHLIRPKCFGNVPPSHSLMNEEIFGPFASLSSVNSFDEFIELANKNKARLQTGVFSRDSAQLQRAASSLRYGGVILNETSALRVDRMPYGGRGLAGRGREGPIYAIDDFTELKAVARVV